MSVVPSVCLLFCLFFVVFVYLGVFICMVVWQYGIHMHTYRKALDA